MLATHPNRMTRREVITECMELSKNQNMTKEEIGRCMALAVRLLIGSWDGHDSAKSKYAAAVGDICGMAVSSGYAVDVCIRERREGDPKQE